MNVKMILPTMLHERASELYSLAESLFGIDAHIPTREHHTFVCRCIIAAKLLDDGWSLGMVGNSMGKNHSTIIYYKGRYNDFKSLPGYETEREMIRQFEVALSNKTK